MAEEFAKWLKTAVSKHAQDSSVLVVGITGKSDSNTEKHKLIDELFEQSVFCGRYNEESLISIDAYYSEYHQLVFLYLNSYQDADVQEKLFDSDKSFFEALNEVEYLFIEHLFILCVLSHLLIFLHQDLRGDTTLLRHLISVNEMRGQRRNQLMDLFDQLEDFPAIDRLERTREFHMVHMFKKCQLAAEHLGIGLTSLTPHRVPFVYVLLPGESEVKVVNDTISSMLRGNIAPTEIKAQMEQQSTSVLASTNRLGVTQFVLGHVKDIVKNEHKQSYFFLLPKFREFVAGASVVYKVATTNEIYSQHLIKNWLCEELHFIDDGMSQITFYAYELYNYLIVDEKVGPMFFDPNLSDFRHFRALQYVGAFLKTTLNERQLKLAWPKILKQCNSRFKMRRVQCSSHSLSGVRCSLLTHKLPAEYDPESKHSMEEALRGRSFTHCSGYSYTSACSCGKTQKRRLDPFTAKEANYDFYSTFGCCAKSEVMHFQLYNPKIQWNVSQTKSVVVKRRDRGRNEKDIKSGRGVQLLGSSETGDDQDSRYGTYTVVKPKSQVRIVNELLWQYNKMLHEHKGKYLNHMPHSSVTTNLPPLYPSWSVLCAGHSKIYVHSKGLSDQPGFLRGSEFLLPHDDILRVDRLPWNDRRNDRNNVDKTHKEKLKFFIGFEYECVEGHRFIIERANKMLVHDKINGNVTTDAGELLKSDLPLFMPCKCSNNAQLMRLHIVSPKAPIISKLNPLVKFDDTGSFHLGTTVEINYGRYYILRFPFFYEGPTEIMSRKSNGILVANSIDIYQKI
ncbi:hypothetical protein M3Y97_00742200 [Aphelenchoides bicaudatus]|nr:hypothetical protein M3Y97_00742200 [Aphelenchoides bicaudatus]